MHCQALLGCLLLLLCGTAHTTRAASAHIHQHKTASGSKERTEDGAFSPRDSKHYGEDNEHHAEFDHEAILGSVKEAEEYQKLPAEESRRRLAILLTKMDLNNDYFISRNELKAWILRSFQMLTEEESRDRMEDMDSNEDGKVTWEEILQDTYGTDSENIPFDDRLLQNDKDTFEAADLNKDGFLEGEEFTAYTHPEETPRMLELLLSLAFKEHDLNKDQYVDFQEFLGDRANGQDKEWLLIEKEKFDLEFDKNSDGKLDINEVQAWLIPSNEEIANDEVFHLFAAADDDHDDRLSYDEVVEHHDVFVGSEATDYGDHLQDIERFQDEL